SLVTAVDRFVVAHDEAPNAFETPEVAAWLAARGHGGPHPAFDASELRSDGRKLGLGSSAAILAASALIVLGPGAPELAEPARLFPSLREAHRRAQSGGSGIDVAAAWFGGTLSARVSSNGELALEPSSLPPDLHFEVWSLGEPSSTRDFVARVFAVEHDAPDAFAHAMGAQSAAAERASQAAAKQDGAEFVEALRQQASALETLGKLAGVPIVVPAASELSRHLPSGAAFLPSGAGGGDVSLFVAPEPSPPAWRDRAASLGLSLVPLTLGAPGARFID
ncbi:MAG TPA: hypothetical protein VLC09_10050, partial [Polyangiaceae bacterium]|nr:hypothetical protein [Polyangiaceae bacterium]